MLFKPQTVKSLIKGNSCCVHILIQVKIADLEKCPNKQGAKSKISATEYRAYKPNGPGIRGADTPKLGYFAPQPIIG